jgi:hypothetical protein
MKKIIAISVFILFSIRPIIFAQIKSQNNDIWLHYVGKNKVSKKIFFTLEATMRYANGFKEKQQYFVRPSVDYQINKALLASIGYTHYNTFVYGNPAINKRPIPENHVWVQTNFTHQIGAFKLTNRIRDENRWVGLATLMPSSSEYIISDYAYRNRLRYMPMVTFPVLKHEKSTVINGFVGDEVFINIGKNAGATLFNQNRLIIGLGYVISKKSQIQLIYIKQRIWNFTDTIEETNPTFRVSYLTNLDFTKN